LRPTSKECSPRVCGAVRSWSWTTSASTRKGERIKELIEERGCELLYLPPYSPDLNPIEEALSKIKRILRKAQARSREALVEAMGRAARHDHVPGCERLFSSTADIEHWVNRYDRRCKVAIRQYRFMPLGEVYHAATHQGREGSIDAYE